MKKVLRELQTLHNCTMAVVTRSQNFFALLQTPFPGAQDRQNIISWRWSLPAPTDPVWWRSMHAISSYRGNRHRPPAHCKHAHRQDW